MAPRLDNVKLTKLDNLDGRKWKSESDTKQQLRSRGQHNAAIIPAAGYQNDGIVTRGDSADSSAINDEDSMLSVIETDSDGTYSDCLDSLNETDTSSDYDSETPGDLYKSGLSPGSRTLYFESSKKADVPPNWGSFLITPGGVKVPFSYRGKVSGNANRRNPQFPNADEYVSYRYSKFLKNVLCKSDNTIQLMNTQCRRFYYLIGADHLPESVFEDERIDFIFTLLYGKWIDSWKEFVAFVEWYWYVSKSSCRHFLDFCGSYMTYLITVATEQRLSPGYFVFQIDQFRNFADHRLRNFIRSYSHKYKQYSVDRREIQEEQLTLFPSPEQMRKGIDVAEAELDSLLLEYARTAYKSNSLCSRARLIVVGAIFTLCCAGRQGEWCHARLHTFASLQQGQVNQVIFREHKTRKAYGPRYVEIPDRLVRIINIYKKFLRKSKSTEKKQYLLTNNKGRKLSSLSKLVRAYLIKYCGMQNGSKCTITLLRKYWLSIAQKVSPVLWHSLVNATGVSQGTAISSYTLPEFAGACKASQGQRAVDYLLYGDQNIRLGSQKRSDRGRSANVDNPPMSE